MEAHIADLMMRYDCLMDEHASLRQKLEALIQDQGTTSGNQLIQSMHQYDVRCFIAVSLLFMVSCHSISLSTFAEQVR
jgi:hypothetical protein